jgi:uncharacterized protein (TIGR03000 family)
MYSVVLMMALSSSATAPAAHNHGCMGGYGCTGYTCGGGHGCHGGWMSRGHSCHGGGHGCHGGGWFSKHHSCHGGSACYGGGCWGSACHGGSACYGGGCWGSGCTGGGCMGGGMAPAPAGEMKKMPAPEKIEAPKKATEEAARPAPATIMVSLPAEAKLTIDDFVTTSTSSTRLFATPTLQQGKDFTYMLKAEIQREGRTLTTSQMVTVRAGEESRIELQFPAASVAQK